MTHLRVRLRTLAAACAAVALAATAASAQVADHQYTSADIEAGSRLYANQCALCHSE